MSGFEDLLGGIVSTLMVWYRPVLEYKPKHRNCRPWQHNLVTTKSGMAEWLITTCTKCSYKDIR